MNFNYFYFFKTGSCYVPLAGLELFDDKAGLELIDICQPSNLLRLEAWVCTPGLVYFISAPTVAATGAQPCLGLNLILIFILYNLLPVWRLSTIN